MAIFTRAIVLDAPFDRVWDAHASVEGLQSVTPSWAGLTIERVRPPAGASSDVLVAGTEIVLCLRPGGIISGGRWVSRITVLDVGDHEAMFRDELTSGPFPRWIHTHRFVDLGFGTLLYDHLEYSLPTGVPDAVATPVLAILFAYRHWALARRFADHGR